jgi:hypothetical protein
VPICHEPFADSARATARLERRPTVNCSALATCGSAADDDDWMSYLEGRIPSDTMHRQRTVAIVSVQCDSDILPWRLGCRCSV